jgi:hypothetical protein
MKIKVISGGQTGVDQAALIAAKESGLETGGWLPKGCLTLDGPRPDLKEKYNLQETPIGGYRERTVRNVLDSDATLRIAADWNSRGEKCTWNAIARYNMNFMDVSLPIFTPPQDVVNWIKDCNIEVLNVAGNSEQTCPGIQEVATAWLKKVFRLLLEN